VMTYFYQMNQWFVWICVLLAVALGFDLITREKEEGSLKSLLSHPVYRDSVINGKTLGAISVLFAAMGAAFLITIAIVLFFGVVPSLDDLLRIAGYFVMALVVCMAFFGLAMAASTIAKNSSMAVLYAIGIVVILIALSQFSSSIVSLIAGPAPDAPIVYYGTATDGAGTVYVKGDVAATGITSNRSPADSSAPPDTTPMPTAIAGPIVAPGGPMMPTTDNSAWQQWWDRQQLIQKSIDAISPLTNFQNYIANALIYDTSSSTGGIMPLYADAKIAAWGPYGTTEAKSVWDALGSVWMNILVLIAETLAAFAVAYVKFLRTDIR
jgi:ABC-2 type transport system permease protein